MRPAARITDMTSHGIPAAPGIGSVNVLICNLPAWRTIDDVCACPIPVAPPAPALHGAEICYLGSTTVLINNRMACRIGDILQGAGPPNPFAMGCPTVLIGDAGFGLRTPAVMAAFAAAMRQVYENWDSMTPGERLAAMQAALNAALPPGMPPLTLRPSPLDPDTLGQLDFQTWSVDINRDMLAGSMTEERFAELTNTVYHEGRHGEQWFNAAQYRAAQGQSADQIAREMGIPQSAAEAAVRNPAGPGTSEGAMGESVDTSVYGDRAAHREQVYNDMDNGVEGSYERYRALPEEEDAWRQGDAAEDAFQATGSGAPGGGP